jgi:hypothetical protein
MVRAECGCVVAGGERIVPCESGAECRCSDLPVRTRMPDDIAELLTSAFATRDIDLLGGMLADDARWGDDDHPNKCRSRADVVATFARLLVEGVEGSIQESVTDHGGVAVRLHVRWPNPGDEGRGVNFWQAYLVRDGLITEIQRHDDRRSAVRAIAG